MTRQGADDHRLRRLQDYTDSFAGSFEGRISRDDEQRMSDSIRRDERNRVRGAVLEAFDEIERRLDFIDTNIGQVTPGDHRDRQKATRRVLRTYRSKL